MKHFTTPLMEIQRLVPEDVFTTSCTVEALGCDWCYCVAVDCKDTYTPECTGCHDDWG